MAERIASGEIRIDVNDGEAIAALRKIDAEFDRTMRDIDRQKAEVTIDGQLAPLEDAVANARRKLKQLQGERVRCKIEADKDKLDREIKEAKKDIAALDGKKATVELEFKSDERQRKVAEAHIKALEKTEKALEDSRKRRAKEEEEWLKKVAKTRQALLKQRLSEEAAAEREAYKIEAERRRASERLIMQERRVRESLWKQREREMSQAEREAHRMESIRQREIDAIPAMRRQYAQLTRDLEKLNEQRRKAKRDERARVLVDLEIQEAVHKMDLLKKRLSRIGEPPPTIDIDLQPGRRWGETMRQTIADGMRRGGVHRAAYDAGVLGGLAFTAGMADVVRRSPRTLRRGIGSLGAGMLRTLESLSNMTVRLGPFTATIRQAFIGLSVLAPILLDVVGALGSLVAVTGSAAAGLGALSFAFLGGAIPAAVGMGLVIKDVVQEFVAVKKATKAYNDAIAKGNTDLAKKKMKELRAVMGNVSQETVRQVGEAQKLGAAWDAATRAGRASVWKSIGQGIQTASDLLPQFASRTNEALDIAEKGTTKWLKALRGTEGRGVLDTLMGNFNRMLGPVLDGMGQLVGYFGKVGAEASRYLPQIGQNFENWATKLNDTADGSLRFREGVRETVQSLRDVGALLMSTGRLLKAFFGGGVDAGQSFARELSTTFDRWAAFLRTTEGNQGLRKFFKESVDGARALYNTLGPLIESFIGWASLIAPGVRAFFDLATEVSRAVRALLQMTALQGPVSAFVATLGVLWSVNKIGAATRAIFAFTAALLGMSRAQQAAAASSAAMNAAAAGGAVAGGSAAARFAAAGRLPMTDLREVEKVGKAGRAARAGLAGLSGLVLGVSSAAAGLGIVATGAAAGLYLFATRTRDWERSARSADKAAASMRQSLSALSGLNTESAQAAIDSAQAHADVSRTLKQSNQEERALVKLRQQGKQGTEEYTRLLDQHKTTLLQLQQARLNETAATKRQTDAAKAELTVRNRALAAADKFASERRRSLEQFGEKGVPRGLNGAKNMAEAYEKISAAAKKAGQSLREYVEANRDQTGSINIDKLEQYAKKVREVEAADRAWIRAGELAYLSLLNQGRALERLAPISDKAAAAFSKLARLGGKKLATKISLQYDDPGKAGRVAQSASRALQQGVKPARIRFIVENAKSAEEAIRRIQKLEIRAKVVKVVEQGGRQAIAVLEAIAGRKLTKKEQRIAQRGGEDALAMLARISGRKLTQKEQRIIERGGSAALAILRSIASVRLPDKHQRITIETLRIENVRRTGSASPGADTGRRSPSGSASGKPVGAAKIGLIGEGRDDEYRIDTRTGRGYKTSGPEFAKLKASEAIIPTETRYKARGRDILMSAARDLGMKMYARGKFGKKGEFTPSATIPRPPNFKGKKKSRKPFTSKRGWAQYIEGLQEQQGYWEREVSIRESQVQEPRDMVVEIGKQNVRDPATGEITSVPVYAPNPEIETSYKPALQHVMDAMMTLLQIVRQLVAMIPQAIAANRQERGYHSSAIGTLNEEIKKENKRAKPNKDRIAKKRARRDEHVEARKQLQEDEKQLSADRVEAGFDVREITIAYNKTKNEKDTASGEAKATADEQTASAAATGGGGSGGGGSVDTISASAGLSYGQQAALADTERANVLREFGGNAASLIGSLVSSVGGPTGGGAGPINPALRDLSSGGGFTQMSAAYSSGSTATSMVQGAMSAPAAVSGGGGMMATTGDKTVNVTATFATVPPDPHTFVKGIEFEAQAGFSD